MPLARSAAILVLLSAASALDNDGHYWSWCRDKLGVFGKHLEVHTFDGIRGLAATHEMGPDTVLFTTSKGVCARDHASLGKALLSEKAQGKSSIWHPWIAALPSHTAECFRTQAEPNVSLKGTLSAEDVGDLMDMMLNLASEICTSSEWDLSACQWAATMVRSRSFTSDNDGGVCLVP